MVSGFGDGRLPRALFRSSFAIDTSGMVQMLAGEPVSAWMPIVPEAITEKTHFIYLAHEETV